MKVVVHPADTGGCGHYRLIFPATVLADNGEDVHVQAHADGHLYRVLCRQHPLIGEQIVGMADPVDADVVVLQRPMHRQRVELIAALQAQGVAVVVEIDDDFHALHKRNPAWAETNPLTDRDHNRDWLAKACERADLVTCSTAAIARRYGAHGRVVILPNLVPARYLDIAGHRDDDDLTVGWTGSVKTHPGDLEVTGGAVGAAVAEAGARFGVVGTGDGVQRALRLDEPPDAAGWLPIDEYPAAVARFDVGIVPLQLSAFNEAKSNLKMGEMAALGVPVVASPTSENRALAEAGVGYLAHCPDDWRLIVRSLLECDGMRADAAHAGRVAMAARTYERHSWRWLDAWAQALVNRRTKSHKYDSTAA